jgi:hypothetical protein
LGVCARVITKQRGTKTAYPPLLGIIKGRDTIYGGFLALSAGFEGIVPAENEEQNCDFKVFLGIFNENNEELASLKPPRNESPGPWLMDAKAPSPSVQQGLLL